MLGDHLAMAVGRPLLGAEETERLRKAVEPRHEKVSRLTEQLAIGRPPVVTLQKEVSQLQDGMIRDSLIGKQLLRAPCLRFLP